MHHLKTWPDPFLAVWGGEKPFEWRKNDRGFKEGDALVLHEWEPTTGTETGRMLHAEVGYILRAPAFGIPEGYCVFALRDVEDATPCDACEIEQADAFPPPDREHVCCRRTAKATSTKGERT